MTREYTFGREASEVEEIRRPKFEVEIFRVSPEGREGKDRTANFGPLGRVVEVKDQLI